MDKINKRTIIIIAFAIISIIAFYYYIIKGEEFLEINNNTNILNLSEENNQLKTNLIDTQETKEIENKIVVYITGAVNNEGIYELKENSRIADIIEKAGGTTKEANINNINLAYVLEDGMKIHIPKVGEEINQITDNTEEFISKENSDSNASKTETSKNEAETSKNMKVNINTANQSELEKLPGIGPSTALKVIEYRKENGKFSSINDIKKVKGIGESKFSKIKDLIVV